MESRVHLAQRKCQNLDRLGYMQVLHLPLCVIFERHHYDHETKRQLQKAVHHPCWPNLLVCILPPFSPGCCCCFLSWQPQWRRPCRRHGRERMLLTIHVDSHHRQESKVVVLIVFAAREVLQSWPLDSSHQLLGWTIIHKRRDTVPGIAVFALDPTRHHLLL